MSLKKSKSGKADMFYSSGWFSLPSFCSPHVLLFSFKYTGPFTSVFVRKEGKRDNPKQMTWERSAVFGSFPLKWVVLEKCKQSGVGREPTGTMGSKGK